MIIADKTIKINKKLKKLNIVTNKKIKHYNRQSY